MLTYSVRPSIFGLCPNTDISPAIEIKILFLMITLGLGFKCPRSKVKR